MREDKGRERPLASVPRWIVPVLADHHRGQRVPHGGRGLPPLLGRLGQGAADSRRQLGRPDVHKTTPYDADSAQPLIAGAPRTALQKLEEMLRATGANYLLCVLSFGDLAPDDAMRSLELFTREVMPALSPAAR